MRSFYKTIGLWGLVASVDQEEGINVKHDCYCRDVGLQDAIKTK